MFLVILTSWVHNVLVLTELKMLYFYYLNHPQIVLKHWWCSENHSMFSYLVLSNGSLAPEAVSSPHLTSGKDKSKSPSARDAKWLQDNIPVCQYTGFSFPRKCLCPHVLRELGYMFKFSNILALFVMEQSFVNGLIFFLKKSIPLRLSREWHGIVALPLAWFIV